VTALPLTLEETTWFDGLHREWQSTYTDDALCDAYYEGTQRMVRLGIAVPPELQFFETTVNWPRLVVDALEERCDVKSFIMSGDATASTELREIFDANNLDSEWHLTAIDSLVYGRGFLSIGRNEDDNAHPLIVVEDPRGMAVRVDPRTRRVLAALKMYGADPYDDGVGVLSKYATLYLPDSTTWMERSDDGRWLVTDRDVHRLGRVPVIPFFNRRRSARWVGVSEMNDAVRLTDASARMLTNSQVAGEILAVPQRYALGVSKGDFADSEGNPLPVWQAYFGAIWAHQDKDVKVGQFAAADLRNFHETVDSYARWLAGLYGLPQRYFGLNTANPPSADGIRADESRLVKRAERKMSAWGDQLARVMAYALKFRDGSWPSSPDRIKVEWHDAATPTFAAKTDGVQKLTGGQPILSREGGWDELGWSDARKARERAYFEQQESDPVLERLTRDVVDVTGQTDDAASVGV
jgi:hypothetical protein